MYVCRHIIRMLNNLINLDTSGLRPSLSRVSIPGVGESSREGPRLPGHNVCGRGVKVSIFRHFIAPVLLSFKSLTKATKSRNYIGRFKADRICGTPRTAMVDCWESP